MREIQSFSGQPREEVQTLLEVYFQNEHNLIHIIKMFSSFSSQIVSRVNLHDSEKTYVLYKFSHEFKSSFL